MRIWRSSIYVSADAFPPLTKVARDCDLLESIEDAIARDNYYPGALIIHEVFEPETPINDDDYQAMGELITQRLEERQMSEKAMALLYHFDAALLRHINPRGVLSATKSAPLSTEEIVTVLTQLKHHPNWRQQTVVVYDEHMTKVTLTPDGKVSTDHPPS